MQSHNMCHVLGCAVAYLILYLIRKLITQIWKGAVRPTQAKVLLTQNSADLEGALFRP